ncbi:MAG: O-antigen ligase family protein, partial [Patescibacteria group bacterium]|nr:O-antigen ligase family protein [Patescibacteria group bacterium]
IFVFVLKQPFLGLLLVVFTLPMERIPTLDIGLFTLKLDQVFAGMTMISWILKILVDRKKLSPFPLGWPIIFYLLACFISVVFAHDTSRAISVFVFVIFMAIVGWLTADLIDDKVKLSKVIKILFVTTALACLFGLYQFLGDIAGLPIALTGLKDIYTKAVLGFPRIQAFSMEPLYFANFLFIPLGIATGLILFKQKVITSMPKLYILVVLILINIVLGISRGAYVALAAFAVFILIFLVRKLLTIKNIVIGVVSLAIILGSAYTFLKVSRPDALDQFIAHATLEDFSQGESVQKRLQDYSFALDYWQESPVIGIGLGNYGPRYKNYPQHSEVTAWEIVNNQYLETLAETGVIGLIFLIIILLVLFIRTIIAYAHTKDPFYKALLAGLSAAMVAILVQYNFFSTIYIMHIWFLIGLTVAAQNLALNNKVKPSTNLISQIHTDSNK